VRKALSCALLALALSVPARADEVGAGLPQEARAAYDAAEIAREEGRLHDAADAYARAIEAQPLYLAAHAGYLECLRALGDTSRAAPLYAKLAAAHPDSVELRAFQAAAMPPAEGLAALAALAKSAPENPRVLLELGRAQLQSGQHVEAERALRAAMKLRPDLAAARVLLGDVYLAQGKVPSAKKEYEGVLELEPTSIAAQLRLALCLHRQEKSDKALETLGRLLSPENYPRLAAGRFLVATIHADRGEYRKAIESLDALLAAAPKHLQALLVKGDLLLREGNPAEAVATFQKAVEAHPQSAAALFALGWANERWADAPGSKEEDRSKRLEAAAQAYRRCADMEPRVRFRDSLGFVLLLRGEHPEAVTQFKRARDLDPKFAPAENNLGLTDDLADRRADAMKRYEGVLEKLDKKNVRALVMLGLDSWLQGSASQAIKHLQAALKLDPKDDLAWMFLGDIFVDGGKLREAVNAFESAVAANPRNFEAWYHMGQVLDDGLRRFEDADRAYRKALECKPDAPLDLILRLAEVNDDEALERYDQALVFYQTYRERGGTEEWVADRIAELQEKLAKK
jgi:tetratricopeptide (TPR) repeat protein